MKRFSITVFVVLGLLFSVNICWAENAYVTNSSKITLRSGPGTDNKIVTMLSRDTPVSILERQGEWSHVRLLDKNGGGQTGWMVSDFLTSQTPWKIQAVSLRKENVRLKAMKEKLARAENLLEETGEKYESLKKASGSFIELRDTHDETLKSLQEASVTLETLQKENLMLKSSQRNRWFLTGAVVLLVGLIFGLVMGRQQRKRRSSYY